MDCLEQGFELDRLWHWLRGEMEQSKKSALHALADVLASASCPYAVIGGVALQIHRAEPRTTLDIDVAVTDLASLPRAALAAAGFSPTGTHPHSDNWMGPDSTPVQFTDDPVLHDAVRRADLVTAGGVRFRVITCADLLHAKLRAASDPARRRSKRLQHLADAQALVEEAPALEAGLSPDEKRLLQGCPGGTRSHPISSTAAPSTAPVRTRSSASFACSSR